MGFPSLARLQPPYIHLILKFNRVSSSCWSSSTLLCCYLHRETNLSACGASKPCKRLLSSLTIPRLQPPAFSIPSMCALWTHLGPSDFQFSSVQFTHSVVSDSVTPCTTARQASLSITNSRSLPTHVH